MILNTNFYLIVFLSQDHFFENLGKAVDHHSEKYDKFLLLGDCVCNFILIRLFTIANNIYII